VSTDSETEPFTLLVTFGTDHHRFSRLSEWLEPWLADHPEVRCLVQEGYSSAPAGAETIGIVARAELLALMGAASVIVGQGGPGTILDAAVCGKLPIVVPRLAQYDEVVDDHQVAFCRRMAADGRALLAESMDSLHDRLDAALEDPAIVTSTVGVPPIDDTITQVRVLLDQLLARRPGFVSWRCLRDLLGRDRPSAAA
jgi:UDP-N-acetylglucosamine transferase subunit ALG13